MSLLMAPGIFLFSLMIALWFPVYGQAQQASQPPPPPKGQSGMVSGIAGGMGAAPVYDAQRRPITAGGFVDSGPIVFEDVTKAAGLSGWKHKMGVPEKKYIVETNGSGVCLLDYDNDGWLDIYLVNGSTFDALDGKETPPHAALFHNNHDGTFTDVSAQAGVANDRWGYGCSVADYDNDGWPDIYVGTTARIASTTTITMEPSPMWPRRPAWPWITGPPVPPGATTTATDCLTFTLPVMCISTATTCPLARPGRWQLLLPVSWRGGELRTAWLEGRT